ncbi:hypothetical protein EON65_31590 [archaeon]|nr:MAG: hypothetical protein EON65_31590 [archaeon]
MGIFQKEVVGIGQIELHICPAVRASSYHAKRALSTRDLGARELSNRLACGFLETLLVVTAALLQTVPRASSVGNSKKRQQ